MAVIRFSFVLLVVALAACRGETEPAAAPDLDAVVAGHCELRRFEESSFTACRFDSREHELALIVENEGGVPLRSFARLGGQLGERRERLLFAMNAGMYDDQGRPIGLYVEAGRERHALNLNDGPGNFHLKPNGVFAVTADGQVAIVTGEDWAKQARRPRWATQSGPMLVIAGALHPAIQPNGASRQVRNGVGVADSRTAWFAISEEPVSFGRFARFFRDSLGCRDALFLDGVVSSLWDPAARRRDPRAGLGPFVAVFAKADAAD